ncbi:MAG: peptidoglycan DD-metalloendopeptidase family protein [Acidobacteriota bacterium]|nr:peptidoglycan DD-metalloendopeptidase family protein [Acidobacteriota bacterium]
MFSIDRRHPAGGLLLGMLSVFLIGGSVILAEGRGPDEQGGGEPATPRPGDELTPEARFRIEAEIERNVDRLRLERILPQESTLQRANAVLAWPVRAAVSLTQPGHHGISNFVDHDPIAPGSIEDFACGARSYDLSTGYNHQGVDIYTWPFPWLMMDLDLVEVVAAADGTIILKDDGNFDRSCALQAAPWNAIYLEHGDGSRTWYGHLKSGSLTAKGVGQTVTQGEYLGIIGSSGSSTGPHLHFESYDSTLTLNDPYNGTCNLMNANSWWASQRPYYDSAINRLTTGFSPPNFNTCSQQESPNVQNVFNPGSTIYFTGYYRDQLLVQMSTITIYRPDNSVYANWNHTSNAGFYSGAYWWWSLTNVAPSGPTGVWRFEIEFDGKFYNHYFRIGANTGSGRIPGQNGEPTPLTIGKGVGQQLVLDWADSCTTTDVDYEIYEGRIGGWYGHEPIACTTESAVTATIDPDLGDRYYLVVPTDTIEEGSHGRNSQGVERSPGSSSCLTQTIAICP